LAAARLRALLRERDRRAEGWQRGLDGRTTARAALDALDDEVLEAADARAAASTALADAEVAFRGTAEDRRLAEQAFRGAVEREGNARAALASQASRAARVDAVDEEIVRVEVELVAIVADLETAETELDRAEQAFREAEQERRRIEDLRRLAAEETAARRAEIEALERSLASSQRERDRLGTELEAVRVRVGEVDAERAGLEAEIETFDDQSAPMSEKRAALEGERRGLVDRIEELEDVRRRHESRRDLLEARRQDIEETAGSRFLKGHKGHALGLLKDLVKVEPGLERALVAALGPLADAVVYDDGERALADAPDGDGAILAIAAGGPVRLGLPGERTLLAAVEAAPAARGIASTVLRDVYLAATVEEAAAKQAEHPAASFVTPEGVLVGPAVIHTAREADARAREIRAELQVVVHDLTATVQALTPKRARVDEIAGEIDFLREQIEAADAEITAVAERLGLLERDLTGLRKEEELLAQRTAALDASIEVTRERLADLGPMDQGPVPELPPVPQPPIGARVAVETSRRDRAARDARLTELRRERDELAAHDPVALRADLEAAETARADAEAAVARAAEAADRAGEARQVAATTEREVADREAAVNKAWRDASTELERLREAYEDDDRTRGDIERRIREAERLIREGHRADPGELVASLADDDSVESLEKRSELVQRRLALLGRVNLLATGEFEVLQERHDFMARELDDVKQARRDLLEVIAQVDREITETFTTAYRDVAEQFERLIEELFPGGGGRLVLTDPAEPLTSGIEIEASPGRKRVRRISLLSGGERSLTAMAFLFAIFTARPSPFYLMDEVEPALDDVNLHRFLRLVEGFARESQVLIVTHQKRTMEIAAMMYGISLNRDGTTKVVAQQLHDPTPLESDARLEGSDDEPAASAKPADAGDEAVVELPDGDGVDVPEGEPVG
jgi:chromosome segregation protein